MPRLCTVCMHPDIEQINEKIVQNVPLRTLAENYGLVRQSLMRHKENHLPQAMVKAKEAADIAHADDLVGQVKNLQREACEVLGKAKADQKHHLVLAAIDRAAKTLELQGKLMGQMAEQQMIIVNNPQWISFKTQILEVLENFPEAHKAMIEALENM